MATVTVNVPSGNLIAPTSRGSVEDLKKQMKTGIAKYGQYFKQASDNAKLPIEMLIAFAGAESGVGANVGPAGHPTRGIMQWNRAYAKTQLENEYKLGRMTQEEKDILAKANIRFNADGKTRVITEKDQMNPEINILIGSILLGMYADSYVEGRKDKNTWGVDANNNMRLDRMIAVWNAGAYGDAGKKARFGNHPTPAQLASEVNSITSGYIKYMMGKNGFYDILLQPEMQLYLADNGLKVNR
jgi:hypothetical protein